MKIGIIGLGRMGGNMAKRLRAGGHDVIGFDRSAATRESLRAYFEVDRHFIALAALGALADAGTIDRERVGDAIRRYGIDPEKIDPSTV